VKNLLLVTALLLPAGAAGARADELAPSAAMQKAFHTGASAIIYFTEEAQGDRVVATVQTDDTEAMKVFRFVSVLLPGQSLEISVPRGLGQPPDVILVRRVGDRLLVDDGADIADRVN